MQNAELQRMISVSQKPSKPKVLHGELHEFVLRVREKSRGKHSMQHEVSGFGEAISSGF